ncbi:CopG family transcriptional regulator [Candidatus Magnetomoraceae bacterium gMMP-13]
MKQKIIYRDAPNDVDLNNAKIIKDFLPPPEQLVFKENTVKVTLSLTKSSVDFFKKEAKKYGVDYHKMLQNLIDQSVNAYSSDIA